MQDKGFKFDLIGLLNDNRESFYHYNIQVKLLLYQKKICLIQTPLKKIFERVDPLISRDYSA